MFKVLLPDGRLLLLEEAKAVVEGWIAMNGVGRKCVELCTNMSHKPTGLVLYPYKSNASFEFIDRESILIGGMSNVEVVDILTSLLSKGYCDLSTFEFREVRCLNDVDLSEAYLIYDFVPACANPLSLSQKNVDDTAGYDCDDEDLYDDEYDEYDEYDEF
jgi:hypothetical protein